jgi:hypothetical protein
MFSFDIPEIKKRQKEIRIRIVSVSLMCCFIIIIVISFLPGCKNSVNVSPKRSHERHKNSGEVISFTFAL